MLCGTIDQMFSKLGPFGQQFRRTHRESVAGFRKRMYSGDGEYFSSGGSESNEGVLLSILLSEWELGE